MPRKPRASLRALVDELARIHPEIEDSEALIRRGDVLVDGIVRTNPASLVRRGASIVVRSESALRGEAKLRAALAEFRIDVAGRVALDVGAAAGGFTRVLLAAGASRVYAVDAGHGQLLGSLRQDRRVVNLEATNLGDLDQVLIPEVIEIVTIDLSYLPLREAVPQLEALSLAGNAEVVALVKPQFELRLPRPPHAAHELRAAGLSARRGFEARGWHVSGIVESPVRGARGTIEFLLHAKRARIISRGWRPSN
jgi:23S rRNA (cytidine1920-2'-O)/16S rRNA (cytidine1409-2'-O)-methyltransferase